MTEERYGLTRIVIEGYKSIRKVDIELRNLNVLIGANGSGKSNFIGFFKFMNTLNRPIHESLESEFKHSIHIDGFRNIDGLFWFGRKNTSQIKATFTTSQHSTYMTNISHQLSMEVSISHPSNFYSREEIKELTESNEWELIEQIKRNDIGNWNIYHFHDTSDSAPIKTKIANLHDNKNLHPLGNNLAPFLYRLKMQSPKEYGLIVKTIQRIAPFFKDFELEPLEQLTPNENAQRIMLKWLHQFDDSEPFTVNDLSDGTLRFICLATLLLQPTLPSTILLDEPELGLHPYAVHLLAGMIKSAAQRTQVIVATQSVTLANCFEPEDIIVAEYKDHATQLERLDPEKYAAWLENYKVGELWEMNMIGGNPL